jgi:transcriptional regulator with PAS, ATPase and Fis domain
VFPYPGNVRQLLNFLGQMAVMSEHDTIGMEDLPIELKNPTWPNQKERKSMGLKDALECLEKQMIKDALKCHPTEASAARALGIHTTTLWRKATRHGLK